MKSNGIINGKHYSEYPDEIKVLVKNKEFDKAIEILNSIITEMEAIEIETGEGVAPWYYEELSKIYQKLKNEELEKSSLKRYLVQLKCRGTSARKIQKKYFSMIGEDKKVQENVEIYNEYKINLRKGKMKIIEKKCPACNQNIEVVLKKGISVIGTCCPLCCESIILEQ